MAYLWTPLWKPSDNFLYCPFGRDCLACWIAYSISSKETLPLKLVCPHAFVKWEIYLVMFITFIINYSLWTLRIIVLIIVDLLTCWLLMGSLSWYGSCLGLFIRRNVVNGVLLSLCWLYFIFMPYFTLRVSLSNHFRFHSIWSVLIKVGHMVIKGVF